MYALQIFIIIIIIIIIIIKPIECTCIYPIDCTKHKEYCRRYYFNKQVGVNVMPAYNYYSLLLLGLCKWWAWVHVVQVTVYEFYVLQVSAAVRSVAFN